MPRFDSQLTSYNRAGGPGTSKADLNWLDEKLQIFLGTGEFPEMHYVCRTAT